MGQDLREFILAELNAGASAFQVIQKLRRAMVAIALLETDGNISKAARLLKTHRNNLNRWMREEERPKWKSASAT